MNRNNHFDVIITGGSYAGLAAAMSLGRALKKVLVIDNRKPCNRQTPYAHNFLTHDGKTPAEITVAAKLQVSRYSTIHFFDGTVIKGMKGPDYFEIEVGTGEIFTATQIVFATGISDLLPIIAGISDCWGVSVIHCPYCHGYEVRGRKTGLLANGDIGFDHARLISNWAGDLVLFTNGVSTFTAGQLEKLQEHAIPVIEKEIDRFVHHEGHLEQIVFKDSSAFPIDTIYAPTLFEQHCKIPELMGCELTAEGYLKIDAIYQTTIPGIYAIGDNAAKMRTIANAVAMGTSAGITLSKAMILHEF